MDLQVVEQFVQIRLVRLVKRFAYKSGQLVGVVALGWHSDLTLLRGVNEDAAMKIFTCWPHRDRTDRKRSGSVTVVFFYSKGKLHLPASCSTCE